MLGEKAREVIHRCRLLAACSEQPGFTTRTFLSAPMRDVHAHLTRWMQDSGMTVEDAVKFVVSGGVVLPQTAQLS